jgi:hypothetical protein
MTQDEIIEMAKQCGIVLGYPKYIGYPKYQAIEAFAKLVAAKEREACAEVCEKHADVYAGLEKSPTTQSAWAACIDDLDAIRARGQA